MRETVNLAKHPVKKPNGKKYVYWILRWFGTDGRQRGKVLGSIKKISKRQAEKKLLDKDIELFKSPGDGLTHIGLIVDNKDLLFRDSSHCWVATIFCLCLFPA